MIKRTAIGTLLAMAACCLSGCGSRSTTITMNKHFEAIQELVAAEDIPAGTIIQKGQFSAGKLYYKNGQAPEVERLFEEAPPDMFPGNWIGILEGKKVVRALKKGEVAKIGDITEPDGSAFREPPRAPESPRIDNNREYS